MSKLNLSRTLLLVVMLLNGTGGINSSMADEGVVDGPMTLAEFIDYKPDITVWAKTKNKSQKKHIGKMGLSATGTMEAGTDISIQVNNYGLTILMNPGYLVEHYVGQFRITSVHYNFETAKFEFKTNQYTDIVANWIADSYNEKAKQYWPPYMKIEGFKPWDVTRDKTYSAKYNSKCEELEPNYGPSTEEEFKKWISAFSNDIKCGIRKIFGGTSNLGLHNPGGSIVMISPYTRLIPIGTEGKMQMRIQKNAKMDLFFETTGNIPKYLDPSDIPHLKLSTLRPLSKGAFRLEMIDKNKKAIPFKGLEIKKVLTYPGGTMSIDYDLDIENVFTVMSTISCGMSMLNGASDKCLKNVEDKEQFIREKIDAQLKERGDLGLKKWIQRCQHVLPWGLSNVMGIKTEIVEEAESTTP